MNRPIRALQVPFHTEIDVDGVTMTVCRMDRVYYAKIKLQMKNGRRISPASILPYLVAHATPEEPNAWLVTSLPDRNIGRTDSAGIVHLRVHAPGRYRVYIKEPTEIFAQGSVFTPQEHALSNGSDSGRMVQPLVEFTVTEDADCTFSIRRIHPNELSRSRGNEDDRIPEDGPIHHFEDKNSDNRLPSALDLGTYLVSHQLWADASRAYGANHTLIRNSRFREPLSVIYSEQLTAGTGAGEEVHNRTLSSGGIELVFDHQCTTGGRGRLSFLEDNSQVGSRMSADEALRRTHPATMEFLLQMMDDLNISYARSTGAWRPHVGSTRHRYASAIDLTHARTMLMDENNQQQRVTIHFNREISPNSNPRQSGQNESLLRARMREFSRSVHAYLANARAQQTLGWLGGPWVLTYRQLGVPATEQFNNLDAIAIETDATHEHHIHISLGTDQP